jgi:hypothetical protein
VEPATAGGEGKRNQRKSRCKGDLRSKIWQNEKNLNNPDAAGLAGLQRNPHLSGITRNRTFVGDPEDRDKQNHIAPPSSCSLGYFARHRLVRILSQSPALGRERSGRMLVLKVI